MKRVISKNKARISLIAICLLLMIFALFNFTHKYEVKVVPVETIPAVIPVMAGNGLEIVHGDTTKKQVIFTFDGGGSAQSADKILLVLKKYHIKGTFFLTGKFVENNPKLVNQMVLEGHEIFNHTYDHPYLTKLSSDKVVLELNKMNDALLRIGKVSSKPFFRAPYGDRNGAVLKSAKEAGYQSVYWTVDALDWKEPSGETSAQVTKRILSTLKPGNIYLVHLGDTITGNILDNVFEIIKKEGYNIVSLTQGI